MKIIAVVMARNERKNIFETIASLKQQTLPLEQIIVVNDGSTDGTGELARKLGCTVVDLPYHAESYVSRPELAERVNVGLKLASKKQPDYILILGADHPLPEDYVERLVEKFQADAKLVVASGYIKGEPYTKFHPRGSGRLVKASFWKEANNMQYPVCWGWESWLCFKAMQLGYKARCFRNIESETRRPTRVGKTEYGRAMYALGYDWKYVLGRCALTFLKSPKAGLSMFWDWLRHENVERLDVADWVNKTQKKRFWRRFWQIIKHGGRKRS